MNKPQMREKKERHNMSTETKTTVQPQAQAKERFGVRALVNIGMLAAIAIILMLFDIPLPFAPSFYEIDFSEVPVMVGCFAMGPFAGALIEFVKILLNFVFTGTDTAGVGELANFIIGCALCVPAGLIYRRKRTRTTALVGMAVGTVAMTVLGCMINAYILLPTYATAFGMPMDALVEMGTAVNPNINSLATFVIFAVAPFNLLKGVLVSLIVFVIYKKISPIFRMRLS
jgi:riboflavin transporter FmnP